MDPYSPIKGKCAFWREHPNDDDVWDTSIKKENRRIMCTCFIDGDMWTRTEGTLPADCPKRFKCRYYVKSA